MSWNSDPPPPYEEVVEHQITTPQLRYVPLESESPISPRPAQAFCISLHFKNMLRLVECPPEVIPLIRSAITTDWKGIQLEQKFRYRDRVEFKLLGNPWGYEDVGSDSVKSRVLMAKILGNLALNGWHLLQGADITKKDGGKDALFFENGPVDPETVVFAMSFHSSDRIRIIGASPVLVNVLRYVINDVWLNGLQEEGKYYDGYEFKLFGTPWLSCNGNQSVVKCRLLSKVLSGFRNHGFKLYASLDMTQAYEGNELESWFFRKVSAVYR